MNVVLNDVAPRTEGAQSFLKTPAKNMLINGEWVEAQSGERLDSKDPATGAVNGTIPKGAKADVDAAVKAARDSFESGVWRNMTPDDRGRFLW
jgi:acyl-CoA reductase-like NAD-dependent aldehyde dehydrogenase